MNRKTQDLYVAYLSRLSGLQQPVEIELRFFYCRKGVTFLGNGLVRRLTSTEVRIESDQELPVSGEILLRIEWPFLLQSVCRLELVIEGLIGKYNCDQWGVSIRSYEFRTCGDHSFEPAVASGLACDLTG
jgi:hypothetical protein